MYIDDDLVRGIGFLFVIILGIIAFILGLYWTIPHIEWNFNKSTCAVYVNKEPVYSGYCHFVEVSPVGEYGNSKRVSIYSDVAKFRQVQKYIAEDVEIKAIGEGK